MVEGLQGEVNLEVAPNSLRTRPNSVETSGNALVAGLSDSNCRGLEVVVDVINFDISDKRSVVIPK